TLQRFDPVDQRSTEALERVRLLPLALFRAGAVEAAALASELRRAFPPSRPEAAERLAELAAGRGFPGWERYLPLVASETVGLDELAGGALVVVVQPDALAAECADYDAQLHEELAGRSTRGKLAVPPDLLERPAAAVTALLAGADLALGIGGAAAVDFQASLTELFHGQLPRFPAELETARRRGERVLLVAPEDQHAWLGDWLAALGADGERVELVAGELSRGFRLTAVGAVVFGERQLFPRRTASPSAARRARALLAGLRDLRVGDYVVHRDHGIGQFLGLRAVGGDKRGAELPPLLAELADGARVAAIEVMEIAYAGDRRLLLPLARLDAIERYAGLESVAPRLDQLGGTSWARTQERVKSGMRRLAADLLRLAAERQLAAAPPIPPAGDLQAQFEAAFEYEETADQESASRAIQEDLARSRPMDRLLCGDVGFGKTEVAMRAAFRVVEAGHQAAVLAPTTILADQHLDTFRRRFAGFPVTVEVISRFRTSAEVRSIRARLAKGEIDILIGTHRLLSRDIELPRLALLVVDEEQRFGVAQKEKLRELKKEVHVLSMSATPVPRTLQLSLAGVRDLSVIETPPRDRMAVETAILPLSAELVREAVAFERERGGQIYVVCDRVEGIEEMAAWLREILPEVRLTIGHGQLPERQLADRMHAFTAGDYDLLLATTIIENGIDLPNVNTMLIDRADRFGLAQLYQLRGRVGRGRQLGFCYLTVPPDRVLAADARERLEAIREFTELGSGFRVAARDLEIRGAGNLLGAEQSGHMAAVGMETYLRMLEETVRELSGEAVREHASAVLDLPVEMAIPQDYLPDANLRMEAYRR
ncbi:MAG: DEAD/DEAH box helicase, partial [Thermoanaerobaculia bacterium]